MSSWRERGRERKGERERGQGCSLGDAIEQGRKERKNGGALFTEAHHKSAFRWGRPGKVCASSCEILERGLF